MNPTNDRVVWRKMIVAIVVIVAVFAYLQQQSKGRVVAKAILNDGTRIGVIQTVDWYVTLGMRKWTYRTECYVRKRGGRWKEYPVQIADRRSGRSDWQISVTTNKVVFYRENKPAITFVPGTEEYILHNNPGYDLIPYFVDPPRSI